MLKTKGHHDVSIQSRKAGRRTKRKQKEHLQTKLLLGPQLLKQQNGYLTVPMTNYLGNIQKAVMKTKNCK